MKTKKKVTKKPKKGNTGKKGGQLDNKNAEIWTEERALEMGHKLIAWISEEPEMATSMHGTYLKKINLFIIEFLAKEGHSKELTSNLADKFPSFYELLKIAKGIQESKILKYSVTNKLNPAISIFCLKNHHGYADKIDMTTGKLKEAEKYNFGW